MHMHWTDSVFTWTLSCLFCVVSLSCNVWILHAFGPVLAWLWVGKQAVHESTSYPCVNLLQGRECLVVPRVTKIHWTCALALEIDARIMTVRWNCVSVFYVGMLIFENLNSRYENFNSRDSTSSRIPDALTDHVLKVSQVRSWTAL